MHPWARQIREGDLRALARAATGIENGDPEALNALRELAEFTGRARIVGITGPPGAGKSTLVDAMAAALRAEGRTVAILAIDPTSRRTGGAILGDRIRMQRHYADPGIFIRSMATRGASGGVARATADLARLMDAAGRDFVIVETVGVGQDEIEIVSVAQITVVVLVPGMGDDVQAIKAGIMEIADVFVINKADLAGADRVERDLEAMLSLADGRKPAIVKTVATEGRGVDELLEAIGRIGARQSASAGTELSAPEGLTHAAGDHALPAGPESRDFPAHPAAPVEQLPRAVLESLRRALDHLKAACPEARRVVIEVPDLAAAVESLRAAGVPLVGPPGVLIDPASTGGVRLELIQESTT